MPEKHDPNFDQWLLDDGVRYTVGPGADPMEAARAAWHAALKSVRDREVEPDSTEDQE